MSTKQFKDLNVGEVFTLNGIKYTKLENVRISCCRSINAVATDNDQNKTQVAPLTEVEIDDQLQ